MTPDVPAGSVIAGHDAVLCDLDGVVYRGPERVPGADRALAELRRRGLGIAFVTNNAARPPEEVAAHLTELGVPATAGEVVTAAQAAAHLLARRVPPGAKVLVVGADHLVDEVGRAGLRVVGSAADDPAAVVQGYGPRVVWEQLTEAAYAVQSGALWVASNADPTRPTERGLAPGAGAGLAAVAVTAPGRAPLVAGKPEPALVLEAVERVGANSAVFVGDRLDTDIAGARAAGLPGILVLTGAHGKADLVAAVPTQRPAQVIAQLGGLVGPARTADGDTDQVAVNAAVASVDQGVCILDGPTTTVDEQLDLLWALANLCWNRDSAGVPAARTDAALAALDRLP
ncbi:HAD-IIA family hydrolase [Naumannella huperziae]